MSFHGFTLDIGLYMWHIILCEDALCVNRPITYFETCCMFSEKYAVLFSSAGSGTIVDVIVL